MSDKREDRLKKLEEKRQKLQAYRDRNKKTPDVSPTPSEEPVINKFKDAGSVEALLGALETDIPNAAKGPEPEEAPQSAAPSSANRAAEPKIEKKKVKLSLVERVADFSVPPKTIPTYNKGIDTGSSLPDIHDEEEQSHGGSSSRQTADFEASLLAENREKEQENSSIPDQQKDEDKKIPMLSEDEKQRILQSKELVEFLESTARVVERASYVSKTYDILVDYAQRDFKENDIVGEGEISLQCKLVDERWSKNRSVTSISWSPKFENLLLASYSENSSGLGLGGQDPDGVVLLWSLPHLLPHPEYVFTCQSQVLDAVIPQFGQSNGTIVIGGTYSGQIVLWDSRAKATPVQHTPLSAIGHTHPVYSVQVVGTQNSHNLITISTDGRVCAWALDNLTQPLETLQLERQLAKTATPIAPTCASFPFGQANHFYMGTEEGTVFQGIRHGSNSGVGDAFEGHFGPITSIDFHPPASIGSSFNFSHLFLTSAMDWSCNLWSRKVSKSLSTFHDFGDYVYDAKWSPVHPAVFATADGTGTLDIWNLNNDTEKPIIREKASHRALNKLSWSANGKTLVTGDAEGVIHVYDVGEKMSSTGPEVEHKFEETCKLLTLKSEEAEETL